MLWSHVLSAFDVRAESDPLHGRECVLFPPELRAENNLDLLNDPETIPVIEVAERGDCYLNIFGNSHWLRKLHSVLSVRMLAPILSMWTVQKPMQSGGSSFLEFPSHTSTIAALLYISAIMETW